MSDAMNSSIPMYYQIAQVLRHRITSGELGADGKLTTERAMCEEFGVSRTTVRHAFSHLKQERLLSSQRGVGTRRTAMGPPPKKYVGSSADPLHAAVPSKPRVVSLKLVAEHR